MSNTFFTAIGQAITGTNKRINIDIEGLGDGRMKVLLSANLGPTPEKASDAEMKLRAAIAMPLLVSGTAEEIEVALHERVRSHAVAINEGAAMLEQIRALGTKAIEQATAPSAKPPVAGSSSDSDDIDDNAGGRQPSSPQPPVEPITQVHKDAANNLAGNF